MQIVKPGSNFDFVGKRKIMGVVSIVAVTVSLLIAVVGSVVPMQE